MEKQAELIDERSSTWEGQIVEAIAHLVIEGNKDFNAQDIIKKADLTDRNGQLVKGRAISKYMKQLGFKAAVQKRIGDKNKKVFEFDKDLMVTLFKRYIPDENLVNEVCNFVTNVTLLEHTAQHQEKLQNVTINALNNRKVTKVTRLQKNGMENKWGSGVCDHGKLIEDCENCSKKFMEN